MRPNGSFRSVDCQAPALEQQRRAPRAGFCYRAFGLAIHSEIELPQLPCCGQITQADLVLRVGEVEPSLLSEIGYRRGRLFDDFRYEAIAGREVVIEALPGAAPHNIADGIMSRVLTIVAYQRGLLPLHASAVDLGRRAIAVSGLSGAGKSTMAALLAARGGRVIADDMLVLPCEGALVRPGAGGLKLSSKSLARIGRTPAGLALANDVEGKYFLPLPSAPDEAAPISTLVRLEDGAPAVRRLSRPQAAAQWQHCVRQTDLLPIAPDPSALWRRWLDLVTTVDVLAVSHGRRLDALDRIIDDILDSEPGEQRQHG